MKIKYLSLQLVAICIIIFIAQILFPITNRFALISAEVLSRPWTLLSSIFLHGHAQHLLYNMFALALFGFILEKIIGSKKFLILFFAAGLIASVGAALFYKASLGASGAIFGILGCLAVLRPRMRVFVGMIPMPMAVAAAFWAIGDLIGMFAPSGIANAAHLFGLGFGIVFGILLRKRFGEKFFKIKEKVEIPEEELEAWEERWM